MLINAHQPEELRIAVVDEKTLENYQVEVADQNLTRGNIYRGVISSIQPSLNAAFIDYGAERNGFLAIQDVVSDAWYRQPPKSKSRPRIEDVLDNGRPIVVQVTREPEAQKGAALTTNLSLAGRYLVLTPFEDTRGISRKVESDKDRQQLKKMVGKLKLPKGCGVIVRTNAVGQTQTTLNRDLAALLRLWKRIEDEARKGADKKTRPKLLYSDQDLVLQALRDYLDNTIEEILVDDDDAFARAQEYMKAFMPRGKAKLVRYDERQPLFSKFEIERQIDRIYERSVALPSGGSIVIDRTEALTAVDVNSGRANKAASQEETAVQTNVEAAREVARQLRLRDLGGLLVVDFIDMRSRKNQRKVEKALRDALKADRARANVGRISNNGLLEINRQRIQQALSLRTHRACPTCAGTGRIASPEMVGLNLLRRIAGRAAGGPLSRVRILLHPELADAFQNGRRREIAELEQEFDIRVEVVAASHLHRSDQQIEWFQREKVEEQDSRSDGPRQDLASIRASVLAVPEKDSKKGKSTRSRKSRKSRDDKPEETKSQRESSGGGKSRRRRSRRKKSAETTSPEPKAQESREAQEESKQQTPTRRRRRRRRKGSAGSPSGSEPEGQKAQPKSDSNDGGGESSGSTTRRRRRRTRGGGGRKKSGEAGA